jgi:hypothetical protein
MVTESQKAVIEATVAKVEEAYREAVGNKGFDLSAVLRAVALGDGYQEAAKDLVGIGVRITKLKGKFREWAEAGERDDGEPFTWENWVRAGQMIQHDIERAAWATSLTGQLTDAFDKASKVLMQTAKDATPGEIANTAVNYWGDQANAAADYAKQVADEYKRKFEDAAAAAKKALEIPLWVKVVGGCALATVFLVGVGYATRSLRGLAEELGEMPEKEPHR